MNSVFWDMSPCGSCNILRSGEHVVSIFKVKINELRMLVFTQMMEATRSSETSVLTRNTRQQFPEDAILNAVTFPQSEEIALLSKYKF
jgi:hypothetical protein